MRDCEDRFHRSRALSGAWAASPAPPRRRRQGGASAGSQGNRVQQFQLSGRQQASPRLPAAMCAAEVDHRVAQRYVIKRRLGKGVSPGKRPGDRGTRPPAGRGQGQSGACSLRLSTGTPGWPLTSSTDWRCGLGQATQPLGASVSCSRALRVPIPRKLVRYLALGSRLQPRPQRSQAQ